MALRRATLICFLVSLVSEPSLDSLAVFIVAWCLLPDCEQQKALASDGGVSREEFVEWARDTKIQLSKWELNPELIAFLDRALDGKRIVFVGESDHGIHEKYDVQAMLIRHLATRGYRHVFNEGLGTGRSRNLDRIVREGGDLKTVFQEPAGFNKNNSDDPSRWDLGRHWSAIRNPEIKQRSNSERVWYFGEYQAYNALRAQGEAPL